MINCSVADYRVILRKNRSVRCQLDKCYSAVIIMGLRLATDGAIGFASNARYCSIHDSSLGFQPSELF